MQQFHRIIEGALFAAGEPLSLDRLIMLFDENQRPDKEALKEALTALQIEYEERGIELVNLASGYQFQVKADLSPWIKRLWEERPAKYSRALLETLSIIAYRQPITRGEIEDIRGVAVSSQMVKTLIDREWIRVVGHKDVPGKPGLYATTKNFLDHFGLKSLSDLPPLSDIRDFEELEKNLNAQMELNMEENS